MSVDVRLRGADALATNVDRAADQVETAVDRALDDYGDTWCGLAVRTSPYVTGHMASSHQVTPAAGGVAVTVGTPYAAAVHKRNPWLARAAQATATDAVATVEQALDDAVQNIKGA